MDTLEDYLAGDYIDERQEVEALTRAIARTAQTFDTTYADGWWPYAYQVAAGEPEGSQNSQGTSAMVLAAVGRVLGTFDPETRVVAHPQLQAKWEEALASLLRDLESGPGASVRSETFGDNNPLTLSHLAELALLLKRYDSKAAERFESALAEAKAEVQHRIASGLSSDTALLDKPKKYQPNAFVPIRAMLGLRNLEPDLDFRIHRQFFENSLHDQLSFSSIPDSRFDPAELLFCLEGLLLCAPEAVDESLFRRVIEVLSKAQESSAHWRPNKPFTATTTGAITLPLSVEGANSLARSIHMMRQKSPSTAVASGSIPLLRRFWSWLRARSVRFASGEDACVGWHSEHVNEPSLIHIWDTSQILEYLMSYRTLLLQHSASKALRLSRLKVRVPKPLAETVSGKKGAEPKWTDVVKDREPAASIGREYQVYHRIGEAFIDPRSGEGERAYSMLLYGPPGTGKSTLAKLMADALEWPLITVTVSDFLGLGGAMVESRAKAIFQTLELQFKSVILFDEIDAFLLDRDSKFYRDQDTVFQFMTPGMLTKINDLRQAARSIFIIATNYENRIDPAIKRPGRIDERLLLLPPDRERRKNMIQKATKLRPEEIDSAVNASLYLNWTDIKRAADASGGKSNDMVTLLKAAERSTGPTHYGRRVPVEKRTLREEVCCLLALSEQVPGSKFADEFENSARETADAGQSEACAAVARDIIKQCARLP